MKTCAHCKCEKKLTEYYYHERKWGSPYSTYCKECTRQKSSRRGKDKAAEGDIRFRANRLLRAAASRADCDLSIDWIVERLEKGVCEVTTLPLDLSPGGGETARPFTPSLDRRDPKRGYTKDNTQVVCWIYNRAKGVHNHADVLTLAKALVHD